MPIDELINLTEQVQKRMRDLSVIRLSVSTDEGRFLKVDKKIVQLQNFLFKANRAIKQSNANTEVDIGERVEVDSLLAPLE